MPCGRIWPGQLGIVAAQGRDGIKELLKIIAPCSERCAPAGRCSHEPCRAGGGASGDADADRMDPRETLPLRLVNTVFTS